MQTFFGMIERGIRVGRFDERGEERGFRDCQIFRLFIEIKIGGAGDPETTVPEINGIEIHFHDLVFGILFFQFDGQFDLFEFSGNGLFVGEVSIFDQLLTDGGRAFLVGAAFQVVEKSLSHSCDVQAVVLIKIFIFDGYEGVFQMI